MNAAVVIRELSEKDRPFIFQLINTEELRPEGILKIGKNIGEPF